MSQKEKANDTGLSVGEAFVNACWQPYEAFAAQFQSQLQKQDEWLTQTWKSTTQELKVQREKAQQFYQEALENQPAFAKSEAVKNVVSQAQSIVQTPLTFTLELLDKADAQRSERLKSLASLQEQFVQASKQNQRALFRLVETNVQKLWGV
ncbi:hypothetical protein ACTID9_03840 [Brevibacillus fluminis]|uniref:hypothetical protein n=1 Tax=Brevibacillus fluminis TaxID=511487 RepID=UPI003F897191